MYGTIDSGADIIIMGGVPEAHTHVRKDFKKVDKVPCQQTFHLDGRLDLDLTFNDRTMTIHLYRSSL